MLNCVVIGCRHNTIEMIRSLIDQGYPVDAIITIEKSVTETNDVSGYYDPADYFEDIEVIHCKTYKMIHPNDREILRDLRFRFAVCVGWQRLLPDWFLDLAEVGVFGMHTSRHFLPGGRGRSPITWSIIEGASMLHAHVFKYSSEADRGEILDVFDISVSSYDDINTLQKKARFAFEEIVKRNYRALLSGKGLGQKEFPEDTETWYDKRSPDSGWIDWTWSVDQIHNFVRAQTHPYPGALTTSESGKRIHIWKAVPFGPEFSWPKAKPGEVVEVFVDGPVLVKASDGAVYIDDYSKNRFFKGEVLK